jgi:serine/threonine-protein kinase
MSVVDGHAIEEDTQAPQSRAQRRVFGDVEAPLTSDPPRSQRVVSPPADGSAPRAPASIPGAADSFPHSAPAGPIVPENDPDAEGLPRRFGKYTLLRKLASGGMAQLFLALQKSVAGFEKLVVIKRILPQMNQDRAFIDMLLHEARIAATLSHPNIVQIFDVGQVDGTYFIAMEHIHGEDIRSLVRQMKAAGYREFPLEHAIGIALGMCAGLAYAHEKRDLDGSFLNIVHRDISPQNVVITFSGDVKIVDFGIAKSDAATNETKSGRLKGKVPYMSPEQARGERLDARSDIFAAGVILFELTTGKRLFKGQSEYETLKLICDRDYPLPSWVKPGYPAELERIVMKALGKDREDRFQTAREMQAALEEFVRHERIRVSTIALQHFMQELFTEKLLAQKEELLQGKQLADVIEARYPSEPLLEGADASRSSQALAMTSTPGASRTLTEVRQYGRKRRAAAIGGTILAVGALVGVATATLITGGERPNPPTAVSSTTSTLAPIPRGTVEVTSNPPGAAIWINGDLRPEVTPAKLADLPLGRELDVKITKDGFEPERRGITLAADRPQGKVDAELKTGSVTLEVVVSPAGIQPVILVDGKRAHGLVVEGLTSGDQHKIIADAPGYAEQTFTFIGAAQENKRVEITLHKDSPRAVRAPIVIAPAPVKVVEVGTGKLNVAASGGWCNLVVDGVARGATPVAGIELAAGPHKLVCTPADGKPAVTATVQVPANDVARHRFTLSP